MTEETETGEGLLSPRGTGLTYGPGEGDRHRRESFFGVGSTSKSGSAGVQRRATVSHTGTATASHTGAGRTGSTASGSLSQPLIPVDPEFYVEMNVLVVLLQGLVSGGGGGGSGSGERSTAGEVLRQALEWLGMLRPHFTETQKRAVAHMYLQNTLVRMPSTILRGRVDAYLTVYATYARLHSAFAELRAVTPDSAFDSPTTVAFVFHEIAALLPPQDPGTADSNSHSHSNSNSNSSLSQSPSPSPSPPPPTMPNKELLPFLAFLIRHRYSPQDALAEQARLQRKVQAQLANSTDPLPPSLLLHRQGFLFKRGHVVKNWKRRWFVVDAHAVQYYEAQGASDLKGSFPTADIVELILPRDDEFGKPFCIQLILANKAFYVLQCQSYAELKSWIDTFYQILGSIQMSDSSH